MRRNAIISVLVAATVGVTGCGVVLFGAGAAVGAGALVWHRGWLRGSLPEPIERVQRAAKAALGDLNATVVSEELKGKTGMVDATMPDGRRVVVETRLLGPKDTQVRIRVGIWGDQDASLRLFEQMKKHL